MTRNDMICQATELQAVQAHQKESPISYFQPQPYQAQLFDMDTLSDKRIIGVMGGNKSGKSYASIAFILKRCLEQKQFVIVATWSNLLKELSKILYELMPKNNRVKYAVYNPQSGFIRRNILFDNGSEIILLTYEQGRERFQSYSCDYILLDEEPPKDVYDECLFRVAHTDGCILISATPVKGFTYLQQLFDVQRKTDNSIIKFEWDNTLNTYINQKSLRTTLDSLSEDEMLMRRFGKFVNQKSGLVFNKFDWERNVAYSNPFYPEEYNPALPILLCADFNYSILPFVLMQKYGDKYYCFATESMKNGNTETLAIRVKQNYPQATFKVYCDASGKSSKTSASKTDIGILESIFGVRANYRHVKNIKDRTESLNAYLLNSNGEARLIINQRNKELLIDFQTVDWTMFEGRKQGDRTHHVDGLSYYFYFEHALNWNISNSRIL